MKLLLTLTLLTAFCVEAQEFKEGIIFDLRGPVKSATLTDDFFGMRNMTFTEDGKCQTTRMEFDENGYPLGMTLDVRSGLLNNDNDFKGPIAYKVDYDDAHRISSTYLNFPSAINPWEEIRTYSYNPEKDKNHVITGLRVETKENGALSTNDYVYSDYVYDEQGNWISRNVHETICLTDVDGKSDNATNEYVETRTVTYY